MSKFGGGKFTAIGTSKAVILNDTLGIDTFTVNDADGFPVFRVDSLGNIKMKGKVLKI